MTTLHIYTTGPSCQRCTFVKRWLAGKGIAYTETNITTLDEDEYDEVKAMLSKDGYSEAPVVYFDDNARGIHISFSGADTGKLEEIAAHLKEAV